MFDTSWLATPKTNKSRLDIASTAIGNIEMASDMKPLLHKLDVPQWLEVAAPVYHISKNLNDYVVVPVIIAPSDIPNRNSVAFPYEELLAFNPREGRPTYKTWTGKPTYQEHANGDWTKAKGIVFDTTIKPMLGTKNDLCKLMCLCAYDITKDPVLAKAIRDRRNTCYSMGSVVENYECSICGSQSISNQRNQKESACGHVIRGKFTLFNTEFGKKPAYYLARDITGFEVSSVGYPAWVSASEDTTIFDLT